MEKRNKKGFVLIETIIVSIFVTGVLLILYIQLNNINNSYYRVLNYDSVASIYLVDNIKDYVLRDGFSNISTTDTFLDITSCDSNYFQDYAFCENLFRELGVSKVLVAPGNISTIIEATSTSDNDLDTYIKTLNDIEGIYIIAYFEDFSYASIGVGA